MGTTLWLGQSRHVQIEVDTKGHRREIENHDTVRRIERVAEKSSTIAQLLNAYRTGDINLQECLVQCVEELARDVEKAVMPAPPVKRMDLGECKLDHITFGHPFGNPFESIGFVPVPGHAGIYRRDVPASVMQGSVTSRVVQLPGVGFTKAVPQVIETPICSNPMCRKTTEAMTIDFQGRWICDGFSGGCGTVAIAKDQDVPVLFSARQRLGLPDGHDWRHVGPKTIERLRASGDSQKWRLVRFDDGMGTIEIGLARLDNRCWVFRTEPMQGTQCWSLECATHYAMPRDTDQLGPFTPADHKEMVERPFREYPWASFGYGSPTAIPALAEVAQIQANAEPKPNCPDCYIGLSGQVEPCERHRT